MNNISNSSITLRIATFLLRLSIGIMFFLHGIGKAFLVEFDTVVLSFINKGFPVWTAYASTGAEILAGLFLIIGFYTQWAAISLIPITIGIIAYHFPNGWVFHNAGGGWEYPQLILISLIVIGLLESSKKNNLNNV
ncbi:MAG: DoxX family protein [Bacteroidota bacterium]